MFQSFEIKNFRGFSDFTIQPLSRLNLITGMNNVGKTALLEALFLHVGVNNTQIPLAVNVLRGIDQIIFDSEELFGWMFYGRNTNETIELISVDNHGRRHSVQIRLEEPKSSKLLATNKRRSTSANPSGVVTTSSRTRELVMRYKEPGGQTHTARVVTTNGTLEGKNTTATPSPAGIFLTTHLRTLKEDAERFSRLERVGQEEDVVSVMRYLEPRLRRLTVLVIGGASTINADIGIGQLVPVSYFGEGFGRLLSIICAIATTPNGTILIDELENGLHHSVLIDTWKAILVAATHSNAQVFATTHSWECVRAAQEAFDMNKADEFRLHRLERIDGTIRTLTYDREALSAAVEFGLETR